MTRLWAGLDIGVETTSIAVINDAGEVLQEATCATTVAGIHQEIAWLRRRRHAQIGLESGMGAVIARGLRTRGYAVNIFETRKLSKFLRARRNKTDAGDAIGIAEAGRIGATVVSRVHLKSIECQAIQSRLAIRRHMIRQRVAAVNLLCRQIELYGGRIRQWKRSRGFPGLVETELKRLFRGSQTGTLVRELRGLLDYCDTLVQYQRQCDRELGRLAVEIEPCRRFMEIPGVGPICALTYYSAVGDPERFRRTADVGAYFGLTPQIHHSGLTRRSGRISRMGSEAVRTALTGASMRLMRSDKPCGSLREWANDVSARRGRGRARVALARKLAMIMLSMWKGNQRFRSECGRERATSSEEAAWESNPVCPSSPFGEDGLLRSVPEPA